MKKYANQSENALQKSIVTLLRHKGFFAASIYNGGSPRFDRGRMTLKRNPPDRPKGLPDVFACKDGKTLFFEIKTKTGRISVDQALVHNQMLRCGVPVHVLRSLEDLIKIVG